MKRLILCCDGTWNTADQDHDGAPCPTNVVKLAYRVAKRDPAGVSQVIFYDQGVGTGNHVDRLTGGAVGEGLEDNIHDAYRFLIANYEPGDEIYLFGFSRGAFTARSIAGMIRKCGILDRASVAQYVPAKQLYHSAVHPDDAQATAFRTEHSCCGADPIKIRFIGVWDTVGALGIPLSGLRSLTRRDDDFHDTELSGTVEYGYHALAIDEHRGPFVPSLWMEKPKPNQVVEQTWFPGVHSDVGGGYPEAALPDVALDWMVAKSKGAGLAMDEAFLHQYPLHPDPLGTLHDSRSFMYKFTKSVDRPIATEDANGNPTTQRVHESVLARWDHDPSYRPKNVRDWLAKRADPRAGRP
jgi:uncharacterized protein (DUF2235 family)